jgi:CO/xanthine dehydrogenase Mo-binding subunit
MHHVRVLNPTIGASFGNKDESRLQYLAALAARKAGRPVKLVYTFSEELRSGRWRHPSKIAIKMGVKHDGTITAIEARCVMNTGPYVPGANVVRRAGHAITYLYRCPNVRYEGLVVYTNTPVAGSYRALGAPQGHFALESLVDKVAEALQMDPLEFRRRNQVGPEGQPGEPNRPSARLVPPQPVEGGIPFSSNGLAQCLEDGARAAGWTPRPLGPRRSATDRPGVLRGLGMAASIYQTGQAPSSAVVRVNPDGTAQVIMGTLDVGQGSNTTLSLIAAEALGLAFENVQGYFADAEATPFSHATAGSTVTFSSGIAVREAAQHARTQILESASEVLEAGPEDLDIEHGEIFVRGLPERRMSVSQAVGRRQPAQVIGQASTRAGSTTSIVNSFAAHFAEVEVDTETGQVSVLRYVAAHDCGRPINRLGVEGQVRGGVLQGLGYALSEEINVDSSSGNPSVANLDSFKLPTARDIPAGFEVVLADVVDPVGPFGAKAIGEPPLALPAAVIANAVYDATGVRVREVPLTPERILAALKIAGDAPR